MPKHNTPTAPFIRRPISLATLGLLSVGTTLTTAALADATDKAELKSLPKIAVVGQAEGDTERQPGAVAIITQEELQLLQPRSTEEALRAVPGVSIKGEEESAIVANIGIRGISAADYKTLILEDSVPVAPGLFVGNGRYYNPRVQRMESIEVLKGAASLRYGPSTIGGVINYISKDPQDGAAVSLRGGSWNTREATLELGGSTPSQEAKFGAFITHISSDGFLDKGYSVNDIMLKTGLAIGENQWLSVKYSDYDSEANISYRGHFLQDFESKNYFNPAPDDYFLSGRRAVDINHEWDINENATLNTLVYGSETYRDYWRYGVNASASDAQKRWVYTDSLNGNNRRFERFGIDSRLKLNHSLFGLANEAEIGVRLMNEIMFDQNVAATRATPRTGTLGTDREDSADSLALYAQNRFLLSDQLAITAGLRVEQYEQKRKDKRVAGAAGNRATTDNTEVMPGLGVTYQLAAGPQLFASVYKAFSPALNGDALDGLQDQELDAERALNLEAGIRYSSPSLSYELTYFRMDFDNQIIPANSNTNFQKTNGGETLHQGLEAGLGLALGAGFSVKSSLTYIPDAEFVGDRLSAAGVVTTPDGNRITYTPELVANLSLEYTQGKLRSALSLHHTDKQFTDVNNTTAIAENTGGFFTGQIDAYRLLDFNLLYEVNSQFSVSGTLKNLTDENYIASLRQGIYIGPERSVDLGLRYKF